MSESTADEPTPHHLGTAYLPDEASAHTRWLPRRFADSLLAHYRTMDPVVAQFWAAPGVLPIVLPIVPAEHASDA